ncbi:hypothetical protein MPH47_19610 [Psychrobacillus psychrodurans]|uniref:hypothetical protein n=1 Tax=Psychrobacillus psychrodurans TaxID=126157 RepID=UPI001F4D8B65|nr:hypothetical protein [Psychrobacillus psychrodurans]MCK1999405.1 hypothetical protein [Psychrobacillus psychrodurans]
MRREGASERKVRSDKKVDVKPTMSLELKELLYHFAYLSNEPVKDVAERLCSLGAMSEEVIMSIRHWFRRDYHRPNTITVGYLERPRLKIIMKGETGKVTIKFPKNDYDILCKLAHALDLTPTSTATLLIKMTLTNREFMEMYIQRYLRNLDNKKILEVNRLLKL